MTLAREGQITERFTRAVDQLGHDETDVRLGGIYALARIAKDSVDDREPISRLLAAYIRRHSSWEGAWYDRERTSPETLKNVDWLDHRAADVDAAFRILGSPMFSPEIINGLWIGRVDLRRGNFDSIRLPRINLNGARLELAMLRGALLDGVNFFNAHLEAALLNGASLRGAYLSGSHLEFAQLQDADLSNAREIDTAHLQSAKANAATVWPTGFDRKAAEAAGVRFEETTD